MTEARDKGWWKCWRCIEDSPIFEDPIKLKLWIMCLNRARWQDNARLYAVGNATVEIVQGSFVTGRKALYTAWCRTASGASNTNPANRVTAKTLWNKLHSMQKLGCLTISSSSRYSVISVVNWRVYQGDGEDVFPDALPAAFQQLSSSFPQRRR